MTRRFDVAVVGAGAMGLAAALALARRGREVVVFERFEIGHGHGSSHGPTRIFRLAYSHPDYVRMAHLALSAWRELEGSTGKRLLTTTGGLDFGPQATVAAGSLEAAGVPFTWLTSDAVRERWPDLRLERGERALFQESAGVVAADRTVRALARAAAQAGATIEQRTAVDRIVRLSSGDGVEVRTAGGSVLARLAAVAAGAWAGPLLADSGIHVPFRVTQEQVSYFSREANPSLLPTLIDWMEPPLPHRYSVPDPDDPVTVKLGEHRAERRVTPQTRTFDADPAGLRRIRQWSRRRWTGLSETGRFETCLYTNTPDEDFVIDRAGPIVIAAACSGHGFKFTPLAGEIVADLVTGSAPRFPLDRFSVRRPALRE